MKKYFKVEDKFTLESGQVLDNVQIAYSDSGPKTGAKIIWVCHALTGNCNVTEWWSGLFGDGQLFDPQEYRIITPNILGSCYGTTGPSEWDDPSQFPLLTIRDLVQTHELLRKHLEIDSIDLLIGASIGGQQAVEWAIERPNQFKQLIIIATNAAHSPYGIAFNEAQRMALQSDPEFGKKGGGKTGLKTARAIAMLSYRSYADFKKKQAVEDDRIDAFNVASYLQYQGSKLSDRFDAHSYYVLTKAMDSHHVGRNRNSVEAALGVIKAKTLVIGIDSDILFPIHEQEKLAKNIPNASFGIIHSKHGHDAFLIAYDQLNNLIHEFLFNGFKRFKPTTLKLKKHVN